MPSASPTADPWLDGPPQPTPGSISAHGLNGYAHGHGLRTRRDGLWQHFPNDPGGHRQLQARIAELTQHTATHGTLAPYDLRIPHGNGKAESGKAAGETTMRLEPYSQHRGSERQLSAYPSQEPPPDPDDQRTRIELRGMPDPERLHRTLSAHGIGASRRNTPRFTGRDQGHAPTTQGERQAELRATIEARQPVKVNMGAHGPDQLAELEARIMERLAADETHGPQGSPHHRECPLLIKNEHGQWTQATLTLVSNIPVDQINLTNLDPGPSLRLAIHDPRMPDDLTVDLGHLRDFRSAAGSPHLDHLNPTMRRAMNTEDGAGHPPHLARQLQVIHDRYARLGPTAMSPLNFQGADATPLPAGGIRPEYNDPQPTLTIDAATSATVHRIIALASTDAQQPRPGEQARNQDYASEAGQQR